VSLAQAADPAQLFAEIEGRARRIETPCGDGTMTWRIWGDESAGLEPLVLGHGAQGSWSHWIANIDALARERLVVAADMPGHGDSALPETPDHAGITKAVATGLKEIFGPERPVDLVGFSFSGTALAHVATAHPELARRLILIGCGGFDTPLGEVRLGPIKGLTGVERTEALRQNLLGLMLHRPESADAVAIHQLLTNARKARLGNAAELVLPDKLIRVLPRVQCQVDAIWGEFDRPHPNPELHHRLLQELDPAVDFRTIAGAGHWVMYEEPQAFDAALLDMLRQPLRR